MPAYRLHTLVSRLDEAADRLLGDAFGTTYTRFLGLVTVAALGTPTQTELATSLGVSAPAASRMVQTLVEAGLLVADRTPGTGNRRALRLTEEGRRLVTEGGALLERSFDTLLAVAGLTTGEVLAVTDPLLTVLLQEDS
jgi:DNA-binding MarR family transcriptional regulator